MTDDLRITEVAKQLGVTPNTIRTYLKHFSIFLSPSALRKTQKRFTQRDIHILGLVYNHLREGLTYDQVPPLLPSPAEVVDIPEEPQEPPGQTTALQPTEYLDQLMAILEQQRETYQETIGAKDETIQVLRSENERLRDELERSRLPWWKRLSP